jgi:hypothetical protein
MKLPHWAQLVLAFLIVAITWVMNEQASGQLVVPSVVMTILTVVKTVIGMLTDSVPSALAARRAGLAAAAKASTAMLVVGAALLLGCQGCGGAAGQVGTVVIPPVVDLAACVIKAIGVDLSKGETLDQAFADAESQCLLGHAPSTAERATNDPTVEKIWASVVAAEETQGLRLPDGGAP